MSVPTLTLTDFLLARIAEDEAVATDEAIARASSGTVIAGVPTPQHVIDQVQEGVIDLNRVRPWSSPLDPARVLAECEAKRRIVERYQKIQRRRQDGDLDERLTIGWVLEHLALPYADHPDYRDEWRP